MIDLHFEEEMAAAVHVLRDRINEEAIPAFAPSRSRTPLLAAAAAVVILGLGVMWGVFARDVDESGTLVVATQPDTAVDSESPDTGSSDDEQAPPASPDPEDPDTADADADTGDANTADARPEPDSSAPPPSLPQGPQRLGQLTSSAPGVFIVPLPSATAWNVDETALLLYRTGDGPVGHIVVSAATGDMIAEVDLNPPDIEQLYWHPTNPELLVAVEGNQVWSFNVSTAQRSLLASLTSCPLADASAGHPSPPSSVGDLVVLCGSPEGQRLVQLNLLTGAETSTPADPAVTSVHISPSGSTVVSMLGDGSAIARTEGSDLSLDLDGDLFEFVVVDEVEMIVSTRYTGDAIGSVVLFDLATGSTEVIIGPDAGDEFPANGPTLHASGARLVLSSAGPIQGELGGRILLVDLEQPGNEIVAAIAHESIRENNGYWSDAFVSLSPSGRFAAYSTDRGGDSVDTVIVEFPP